MQKGSKEGNTIFGMFKHVTSVVFDASFIYQKVFSYSAMNLL